MDLEIYNKSFEEIEAFDEELDNRLRLERQQCIQDFVKRLQNRQREWEELFKDLLQKSQEITCTGSTTKLATPKPVESSSFLKPSTLSFAPTTQNPDIPTTVVPKIEDNLAPVIEISEKSVIASETKVPDERSTERIPNGKHETHTKEVEFNDILFSNSSCIKEFIRIQELLQETRNSCSDITSNPSLKPLKDKLNLFIRTQINSICVIEKDSDLSHIKTKIRLLTDLFSRRRVEFQNRWIDASEHPQGTILSMDFAAQVFVSVGIRLVNSVPAIAKSMAIVINGIVENNLPHFRELVIGYLQERCPYLIPRSPRLDDFSSDKDPTVKLKIACGYSYDSKTQAFESEEKYLLKMRSMVLLYGCIIIEGQNHIQQAWSWLASFLSLKPEPVITALVLQAFLQETSKELASTYGRQYRKILTFIRNDYVKMIEEITIKGVDRQSLVKLKNLLADDSNLIAAPKPGSIFEPVRRF